MRGGTEYVKDVVSTSVPGDLGGCRRGQETKRGGRD